MSHLTVPHPNALLACLADHLTVTDGAADRLVAHSPLSLLKTYVQKNRNNFVNLDGTPLPKGHPQQAAPATNTKPQDGSGSGFPMQWSKAS
jgi:hypothetical protein